MLRRLQFMWWGRFWRGWLQFGSYGRTCADKDYSVQAKTFYIGPLMFSWWNRPDWERYCFTKEEARAADRDGGSR